MHASMQPHCSQSVHSYTGQECSMLLLRQRLSTLRLVRLGHHSPAPQKSDVKNVKSRVEPEKLDATMIKNDIWNYFKAHCLASRGYQPPATVIALHRVGNFNAGSVCTPPRTGV